MSTSNINCPKCKNPVAVKHHSGRVRVIDGIKVSLVDGQVMLTCVCGTVRKVTLEKVA